MNPFFSSALRARSACRSEILERSAIDFTDGKGGESFFHHDPTKVSSTRRRRTAKGTTALAGSMALGGALAQEISGPGLRRGFAVLLALAAVRLWFKN